jgi:SpoVK/Ycf46/Vps4 family AAA+-type ATPase
LLTSQVAAGQIGVDHVRVEKYLKNIFKIASRWGAILLLDEADVFLTERGLDPHSNALVSVFLRELEHFDGILFLTTNRMQAFDPAILSRIHLPLRYEPLKKEARGEVWRFFMQQATTTAGHAVYDDHVIEDLAMKDLNGREVRDISLVASKY